MASILYVGPASPSSTSYHRFTALQRLGHHVTLADPRQAVERQVANRVLGAMHYRTGYEFLQKSMTAWARRLVQQIKPVDVVWVDGGELIGPAALSALTQTGCPAVIYNVDDPTGGRDGNRFRQFLKALPAYDLAVMVRSETARECEALGAKRVLQVLRSYDEVHHKPFERVDDIPAQFRSEVAFIGTWMRYEKRDKFLWQLIQQGVPVSIWGGRWPKSPYFNKLQPYYRGSELGGRDYVAAMQGAKLCLGMLSKGNRDLHTQRSLEVPYAGGLLCAQRTSEHEAMYRDGEEAVFWSDADECARLCHQLLTDDAQRESIRQAGMKRVRALHVGNEQICQSILDELSKVSAAPPLARQ